ncbi:MAG: 1-deoxy-D-xylulose-5-phosphate synthase [Clostridia bacterium]|nr:1-deoxy-D-xylulose-5-phosphate synthase [Clostridia bacterium]
MRLEDIKDPSQLKALSLEEMTDLADAIRQKLILTVSKTGGHLAPNLGVVELTIALHRVFNSPVDKIIWDVGHQSYVHKILTGRLDRINTLRQYGGISGFPKIDESPHDVFNTGHSSTSISAALGMALARDLNKENHEVVAVIGDGALTGGMAFEALNHAGHLGTKLVIILNDNEMSIANNVGALSSYLTRMRSDPRYYKGKEDIEQILKRLPSIGPRVVKMAERIKDSLKYLVVPGMLFEELGFTYLGPIDGHNLNTMITVFQQAKGIKGPVLVHVLTKKGKGYRPAENNPDAFHGVGAFDVDTGQPKPKTGPPTYTEVFGRSLTQLAAHNPKIVGITAAMPDGTGLSYLAREFPERFFDVGIAEQHGVTLAAGMAIRGYRPVVAIYSTFLQRGFDQVLHDVCLQKLPVVFALDRAGLVGEDGETHHGVFDLSYLRSIPNLAVMAPKDELELSQMLTGALQHEGPVAIRYPRGQGKGVSLAKRYDPLPIGVAEILSEGKDLAILALGPCVYDALRAVEKLNKEGIDCTLINARCVKPLDEQTLLKAIRRCKKVVTVEENVLAGGCGSAGLEMLARHQLQEVQVVRIGLPDAFIPHGNVNLLREEYGLSADGILKTIRDKFFFRRRKTGFITS